MSTCDRRLPSTKKIGNDRSLSLTGRKEMGEHTSGSGTGTDLSNSNTYQFSDDSGIPYFDRSALISRSAFPARGPDKGFHYDLLTFVSLAAKFGVNFVALTWQPALERLGRGASSTVQQGQVDANVNLAFKRAITDLEDYAGSESPNAMRFKTVIFELVALELLRHHPNVVDLLGVTWETDAETKDVWPVLLTERSTYGNMAAFLKSDEGRTLSAEERLKLLEDIARACLAMHKLGECFELSARSVCHK